MKKLFKIICLGPLSVLMTSSLLAQGAEAANLAYKLSQETAPGSGNFTSVGLIYGFNTDKTLREYYNYSKSNKVFNGPIASQLLPNTSNLFVVEASDGTGLFGVNVNNVDTDSETIIEFDRFKSHDPVTASNTFFRHYADGAIYGNLGKQWEVDSQIAEHSSGITSWKAISSNVSQNTLDFLNLSLVDNSRVHIESVFVSVPQPTDPTSVPEPTALVGLLAIGTLGSLSALNRRQK